MEKRRIAILISFVLAVTLLCVVVLSFTLLAAANLRLGGGMNVVYTPAEDDGEYTKEEIDAMADETTEMLDNGGFVTAENGVLKSNTDEIYANKAGAIKMHEVLMGRIDKDGNPCNRTPMIRYMKYDEVACENISGLIVVLDLSRTNIVAFDSGWINLMGYVLVGMKDSVWSGNGVDGVKFPFEEDCTVYDAATGEVKGQEKIKIPDDFLPDQWASYPDYSLRIILPAYATIDDVPDNQVSFKSGSLLFNVSDMAPSAVELDVTHLKLTASGLNVSGLSLDADAGGGNSMPHMHILTKYGRTDEAQAQYGLTAMLDLAYSYEYSGSNSWEFALYMRPSSDSDYARLFMSALRDWVYGDKKTVTLYSAPGETGGSPDATNGVLNMFGFLDKLRQSGKTYVTASSYLHALRDGNGVLDGDPAALGVDFATGNVTCGHNNGGSIGNFNNSGGGLF